MPARRGGNGIEMELKWRRRNFNSTPEQVPRDQRLPLRKQVLSLLDKGHRASAIRSLCLQEGGGGKSQHVPSEVR